MRRFALLMVLVVLAGCQIPGSAGDATTTPTAGTGQSPAGSGHSSAGTPTAGPSGMVDHLSDPPHDRLGWENGYWYNESIGVTPGNGLNASEREAVVSRAEARVEHVRRLEFNHTVPVDVINRSEYARSRGGTNRSEALREFDNAKFEALFLVGENQSSIDVQNSNRNSTVLGYYSPSRDAIVLVSNSDTPTISGESTLAHELTHSLQDQHFDLSNRSVGTRDALQGRNGIIEGDAVYTQHRYERHCGGDWQCVAGTNESGGGGSGDVHPGINFLFYFPYSAGFQFVSTLHQEGGWHAVNAAYGNVPDGAAEVINPGEYPGWEPAQVSLPDRSNAAWSRIEPPNRPNYGVPGQSAISASLAYTLLDDYNDSAVVSPRQVISVDSDGQINQTHPYRYDAPAADGWAGGRFYAYTDGDQLAYVWRTRWDSPADAREFARTWRQLISHWGGHAAGGDRMVIDDGPYADAFDVRVDGSTVTVVNAPTLGDLSAVYGG